MARGVDLNISNSIIQSYLAGQNLRKEREQQAIAAQQRAEEQKRYETEQTRLNTAEARQREQFDLSKLASQINIQEALQGIMFKGGKPAGYEEVTSELNPEVQGLMQMLGIDPRPGVQGFKRIGENPNLPPTLLGPTPAGLRREELESRRGEKEIDFEFAQMDQENDLDRFKQEREFQAKIDAIEAEQKFQYDLQLAKIEQDGRREIARINAANSAAGKDMSYLAQAVINNPEFLYDAKFMTPKQRGEVLGEIKKLGVDLLAPFQNLVKTNTHRAIGLLNTLLADKNLETGFTAAITSKIPGTKAFDNARNIQQLKAILTIPEFKNMVGLGHMSDTEFLNMQVAATTLDIGSADTAGQLQKIKLALEEAAKKFGASAPSPDVPNPNRPNPADFDLNRGQ